MGVRLVSLARWLGQVTPMLRGSKLVGGNRRPLIFIDGFITARGDAEENRVVVATDDERINVTDFTTDPAVDNPGFDNITSGRNIEASKVYRSSNQVPAQFRGASMRQAAAQSPFGPGRAR